MAGESEPTELERRLDATRRLLAVHKGRHAQKLAAGDEETAVSELAAITRLELTVANIEQLVRVRDLTKA